MGRLRSWQIILIVVMSGMTMSMLLLLSVYRFCRVLRKPSAESDPDDFPGPDNPSWRGSADERETSESSTKCYKCFLWCRGLPRQRVSSAVYAVGAYLNKVLRVLFMAFGLLTTILSVVLDNSYNDKPVRFIPFGILAPFTIFFGFLASGWFPRVPLRLIAFLKRHGYLRNVMPCSPWHDNVVTDFFGKICTLEQTDSGASHLPQVLHAFLYNGDQGTVITQSTLALERTSSFRELSSSNAHLQDISDQDSDPDNISATSRGDNTIVMTTGKAPSQAEETVVQIDHVSSYMFHVSDDGQSLAFRGPTICRFPLEVLVAKNTSNRDTFVVVCTFRSKMTRRMYLNSQRLRYLAENMVRWVENPHPIVVDEFSDILHCMPIQDILWEFTKSSYTLKPVLVKHRFLGCLCDERMEQFALIALVATTSLFALIPLLSDTKSLYYLFFIAPIIVYLFIVVARRLNAHYLINHCFKLLLCPLFIRVRGFPKLYKCRSFFIWCNEFRKERVVNPERFLIDQVTANCLLEDGETCFYEDGLVGLPDSPGMERTSPITLECQADPEKLHDYKLVIKFDGVRDGCYIDVTLSFYENNDLLDCRLFYDRFTKIEKLQLVEKLFSYYSDPTFGGYVEAISPCCWSYLGHCPRFLDICKKIISEDPTPMILVATRKPDCRLIIGDSSLSLKAE